VLPLQPRHAFEHPDTVTHKAFQTDAEAGEARAILLTKELHARTLTHPEDARAWLTLT
jgi:hypothetical protein